MVTSLCICPDMIIIYFPYCFEWRLDQTSLSGRRVPRKLKETSRPALVSWQVILSPFYFSASSSYPFSLSFPSCFFWSFLFGLRPGVPSVQKIVLCHQVSTLFPKHWHPMNNSGGNLTFPNPHFAFAVM